MVSALYNQTANKSFTLFSVVYLMQLFADLHRVFTNKFLHCVDSETILICEAYNVAEKTAKIIKDPALLKTPKADDFISNLDTDEFDDITVELWTQENNVHKQTLDSKITGRGNSLEKVFVIFTLPLRSRKTYMEIFYNNLLVVLFRFYFFNAICHIILVTLAHTVPQLL